MQDTELKTSAEWNVIWENEFPDSFVIDLDGWDRSNWRYSWYEE